VQVSAKGHHQVVEDVQEGYLAILLAQHKEHSLQQIHELVEEVRVGQPSFSALQLVIQRQFGDASQVVGLQDEQKVKTLEAKDVVSMEHSLYFYVASMLIY